MYEKGYWRRPEPVQGEKYWLRKNGFKFIGLDIGCGTGRFMNNKMIGVTISNWEISECKKKGFKIVKSDAKNLGIKSNSFKEILCAYVIEHMLPSDAIKIVKECHRVLKPGGKAYFLTEQFNKSFFDDYTHIHPFTKNSLRQLLLDAGFNKVKVKRIAPMIKGYNYLGRTVGEKILYIVQKLTKPFLLSRCKLLGIAIK